MYDFTTQLAIGAQWEEIVGEVLATLPGVATRLAPAQQKALGADFSWTRDGRQLLLECKKSVKYSDKVFLEICHGSKPGNIFTTHADIWLWQLGDMNGFLAVPPLELKLTLAHVTPSAKPTSVPNNNGWNAVGYWVSAKHFERYHHSLLEMPEILLSL